MNYLQTVPEETTLKSLIGKYFYFWDKNKKVSLSYIFKSFCEIEVPVIGDSYIEISLELVEDGSIKKVGTLEFWDNYFEKTDDMFKNALEKTYEEYKKVSAELENVSGNINSIFLEYDRFNPIYSTTSLQLQQYIYKGRYCRAGKIIEVTDVSYLRRENEDYKVLVEGKCHDLLQFTVIDKNKYAEVGEYFVYFSKDEIEFLSAAKFLKHSTAIYL
jgi:hypothetical protein